MVVGDYISERWGRWTGLIISEDYRRLHQYLEREIYYTVLIVNRAGKSKTIEVPASECVPFTSENLD